MRKTYILLAAIARCSVSRIAIIGLLAGLVAPAQTALAAAAAQDTTPPDERNQPIIVTAPIFRDVQSERNLDEEGIGSYGVSTIDELLGEVQVELGDESEEPLILVNGKRINDLSEIGALPVEALRNLQVLPRGSAVRVGGTSNQRVISLTLRSNVRSATVTAAAKTATDGDWYAGRGEVIFTKVKGSTRANLAFRARGDSALLESDRDIIQPAPRRPFALGGNVVGFPDSAGEIDPLLSALAGETVTVVPFPTGSAPTLSDFLAQANQPAVTDLGEFRTLRPRTRTYEINGTYAMPLTPWLTSTATVRLGRNESHGKRGLPSTLFVLQSTNPSSPFSEDVGLAFYGPNPLISRSTRDNAEVNLTLDAEVGRWSGNFNAKHSDSRNTSRSERQAVSTIHLDDSVNPFATDLPGLITLRRDKATAHAVNTHFELTANGPAFKLPAGDLQVTAEGQLDWYNLHTSSTFSTANQNADSRRSEQLIRGAVEIPLASRANDFLPQIGELSATAEYSRLHFSDAGSLNHHAFGLTWEPTAAVRLRAAVEGTDSPAPIETLGNPVIITPDVRVFDPLTGQTVDVTQITGGNPSVLPQTTKIRNVSALLRLVPRLNLQLSGEYTDSDRRNFLSSLPDSSAAIMLAFPERFVRDSSGNLTTVDLRPVNFESDREKRLRWGLSMSTKIRGGLLGASEEPAPAPGAGRGPRRPGTYFQLTANHTVVFSDKIVIRSGLDPVNLLGGGAVGIGGGRTRHQIDGTAALTSGGLGARLGVTWRGASTLNTRIGTATDTLHFTPVMLVNLRTFAEMKRFMPQSNWAKGFRVSLDVLNVFNDRQSVRDSAGNTPLQYQPAYRDAIGRTVELELRKVF